MNSGVCCKPYSQRFGGGGAGGGNGAGAFVALGVRGWRRTGGAGPGQNNSFVLLPLLLSLRRFKCSTATLQVSASDRFSAPFASPSPNPVREPNRCGYEFCQRGALEHSGRSCRTDGSGVTLRTCWSANPQVGFREMLVDCIRSHSPFPLNEHRRKAPTWGPPRIPECM